MDYQITKTQIKDKNQRVEEQQEKIIIKRWMNKKRTHSTHTCVLCILSNIYSLYCTVTYTLSEEEEKLIANLDLCKEARVCTILIHIDRSISFSLSSNHKKRRNIFQKIRFYPGLLLQIIIKNRKDDQAPPPPPSSSISTQKNIHWIC